MTEVLFYQILLLYYILTGMSPCTHNRDCVTYRPRVLDVHLDYVLAYGSRLFIHTRYCSSRLIFTVCVKEQERGPVTKGWGGQRLPAPGAAISGLLSTWESGISSWAGAKEGTMGDGASCRSREAWEHLVPQPGCAGARAPPTRSLTNPTSSQWVG